MANTKSAEKRARQANAARTRNITHRSKVRTAIKKVVVSIEAGDKAKATAALKEATPIIDAMARKGIIHRISSYLSSRNINIEDLYATADKESFLLIAQLQVPPGADMERLQMDVQDLWPEFDVRVSLQHENIFLATSHVDFRQARPGNYRLR